MNATQQYPLKESYLQKILFWEGDQSQPRPRAINRKASEWEAWASMEAHTDTVEAYTAWGMMGTKM